MSRDEASVPTDSEQKEIRRQARNREAVAAIRRETARFLSQLEQEGVSKQDAFLLVSSAMVEAACTLAGRAPEEIPSGMHQTIAVE